MKFVDRSNFLFVLFLLVSLLDIGILWARPVAPVILIHGVRANANSWKAFGDLLESIGWTFGGCPTVGGIGVQSACGTSLSSGDFYRLQFSNNQNLTLSQQADELQVIVDAVLSLNPGNAQVILIGHSMGGLAARTYLQFPTIFSSGGKVVKLITVGTPHQGAELAIICQNFPFLPPCPDPGSIALAELQPDSSALLALNNLRINPLPSNIVYTSIVGIDTAVLLNGQDGDGIVSALSQDLGNVVGVSSLVHTAKRISIGFCLTSFFLQTHTCEPIDEDVWGELLRQLDASPPVDVFFLVDLSGSFADDLPNFKAQAPTIISNIRVSTPNSRFGLGRFEDYPILDFGSPFSGDKAYERLVDLTFDTNQVLNTIDGLFTRSGGDGPQSQLTALFQAATGQGEDLSGVGFADASIPPNQQANFRDGAAKIFMLWTDAPFHHPGDPGIFIDYPGPTFQETVDAILALDPPKVVGVSSGGFGITDLQDIAAATGALAPPAGVDCNNDGIVDIFEREPLVCPISSSGAGIGVAIIALVQAATPTVVNIDIKPGSDPNAINPRNKGVIPVAILTTNTFDATTLDPLSVTFGPSSAMEAHSKGHVEDVDGDGNLDLVLHFRTQDIGISCGNTSASLTGQTFAGEQVQGSDSIRTVGCK